MNFTCATALNDPWPGRQLCDRALAGRFRIVNHHGFRRNIFQRERKFSRGLTWLFVVLFHSAVPFQNVWGHAVSRIGRQLDSFTRRRGSRGGWGGSRRRRCCIWRRRMFLRDFTTRHEPQRQEPGGENRAFNRKHPITCKPSLCHKQVSESTTISNCPCRRGHGMLCK